MNSMKRSRFTIIMLFYAMSSFGQKNITKETVDAVLAKQEQLEKDDPRATLSFLIEQEKKFRLEKYTNSQVQGFYGSMIYFYNNHGLYEDALKIVEDLEENSKTDYYSMFLAGAAVYTDLKNYKKAVEYCQKYIAKAIEFKDSSRLSTGYGNLADIYIEQNNPDEAFKYLGLESLYLNKNNKMDVATHYHNLGVVYMLNKDFDLAKVHLDKSLKMDMEFSESKDYDIPYDYYELGKLEEAQGNLKNALRLYESALLNIDRSTEMELQLKVYRGMYSVCDRLQEYKKGLENSLKYTTLRDSIFSVERLQNLGSMELQNYLRQQQRQERDELNRERIIQYSIVFFVILLTVIVTFYVRRYKVSPKVIGSVIFITILLFFEFVLVVLEPFLNKFTGNTPIYILLGNFTVALLFIPVHRLIENWFEKKVLHTAAPVEVN